MKLTTKISLSIFAVAIGSIFITEFFSTADGNRSGSPVGGYAGDPSGSGKTCAESGCHTGTATAEIGWITTNVPAAGFKADSTYTITATATHVGSSTFGFEISPQDAGGTLQGTLVNIGTDTKVFDGDKYITHTQLGVSGSTDTHVWTFDWTAPATGNGPVTFYGAFNAANGNFTNDSGDVIYTSTTVVSEDMTTPTDISEIVSEAQVTVYPNPVVDNFSVTSSSSIVSINIVDLSGKVLQTESSGQAINISSFDAGIYLLQITTESGELVKRIVKQ